MSQHKLTNARRNPKLTIQLNSIMWRITEGISLTKEAREVLNEMLYKMWNLDGIMIPDDMTAIQLADPNNKQVQEFMVESDTNGSGYFREFWIYFKELTLTK